MERSAICTRQDAVESQTHQPHLEYPGLTAHPKASLCISGHMLRFLLMSKLVTVMIHLL